MNKIEKGKTTLKGFGIALLVLAVLALGGGIAVTVIATSNALNVAMLVLGILLIVFSIFGLAMGIYLTWIGFALKATKGSIAEENLGIGTVNMHKCQNCGVEVQEGEKLCKKCREIGIEE